MWVIKYRLFIFYLIRKNPRNSLTGPNCKEGCGIVLCFVLKRFLSAKLKKGKRLWRNSVFVIGSPGVRSTLAQLPRLCYWWELQCKYSFIHSFLSSPIIENESRTNLPIPQKRILQLLMLWMILNIQKECRIKESNFLRAILTADSSAYRLKHNCLHVYWLYQFSLMNLILF